jgi:hypothetical protein
MSIKLYDLTEDLKRIEDQIIDAGGEVTEELEQALESSSLAVKDKTTGIMSWVRNLDADVSVVDMEIKRLSAIKKARQNLQKRLKDYIKMCMEGAKLLKVDTPLGTLAIQKNPPSVEVVDEDKVPAPYVIIKQTSSIDKVTALADLKAGKEIEGLRLITDKTNLRVR